MEQTENTGQKQRPETTEQNSAKRKQTNVESDQPETTRGTNRDRVGGWGGGHQVKPMSPNETSSTQDTGECDQLITQTDRETDSHL